MNQSGYHQANSSPEARPGEPRDVGAAASPGGVVVPLPRQPGRPRGLPKTGGRKPGTRNRRTIEVEEAMRPLEPRARRALRTLLETGEPDVRLKAAGLVLAYCWGRPVDRRELSGPDGRPLAFGAEPQSHGERTEELARRLAYLHSVVADGAGAGGTPPQNPQSESGAVNSEVDPDFGTRGLSGAAF